MHFSELLNVVEAAKTKLESVIRDLQTEVRALKNKVRTEIKFDWELQAYTWISGIL